MRPTGYVLVLGAALAGAPSAAQQPSAAGAVPAPALENLAGGDAQRVRALLEERYQAAVANPESAEAWGAYAMALEAHRQVEAALEVYGRAAELAPREFRWIYLQAGLLDYSDPRAAAALYERAVALRPDYAPARVRFGETLERLGETAAAAREFERATALDPGNPLGPFGLGRIALSRGQAAEAVAQLRRARQVDAGTQAIVATLARALFRIGAEDEARRLAEEARGLPKMAHHEDPVRAAVQEQAVDAESFLFRARRLQDVGQLRAAQQELTTLLRLEPGNAQAHLAMGGLHDRLGSPGEALRSVSRALELDAALPGARQTLASTLFKLERFDEASHEVHRVLSERPQDFHMLLLGSLLGARAGDVTGHVELLHRAFDARTPERQLRDLLRQLLFDLADGLVAAREAALAAEQLARVEVLLREDGASSSEIAAVGARREALVRP